MKKEALKMLKDNKHFNQIYLAAKKGDKLSNGEDKALRAWFLSIENPKNDSGEFELDDALFDSEVSDFLETLKAAGLKSFLYPDSRCTANMSNMLDFCEAGWGIDEPVTFEKTNRWGKKIVTRCFRFTLK